MWRFGAVTFLICHIGLFYLLNIAPNSFFAIFHFFLLAKTWSEFFAFLCLKWKQKKPNEPERSKCIRERNLLITLTLFQLYLKKIISICAQLTMNAQSCSFLFLQLSVISWLPVISVQKKIVSWSSLGLMVFVNRLVNCVLNLMGKWIFVN